MDLWGDVAEDLVEETTEANMTLDDEAVKDLGKHPGCAKVSRKWDAE